MDRFFKNKGAIFVFAFPTLIIFTVFVVFPLIPAFWISLQDNDGFSTQAYVGISNYIDMLSNKDFWNALLNNVFMVSASTFIGLPISLVLAIVINTQTAGIRRFFKTASFIPAVLSVTVICQMWIAIYQPEWGILNVALKNIGLENLTRSWLSDGNTVVASVTFTFIWQFLGFNMVLFYAGIRSIPANYYEAALIDGANAFQTSIKITIPLLQEITKYVLIGSVLGCMGQFAHLKIMTNGGPGTASRSIIYQLYYTAFSTSEFGKGCAIAVIFVVICVILSIIINSTVAREKIEY